MSQIVLIALVPTAIYLIAAVLTLMFVKDRVARTETLALLTAVMAVVRLYQREYISVVIWVAFTLLYAQNWYSLTRKQETK